MNHDPQEDLQIRILGLLDGSLNEAETARLDADLRASREARDLFRSLSTMHSALEELCASRSEIRRVPIIPIERLLVRQRQRLVKNSLLAAAVVILISLTGLWLKMAPAKPETLADFQTTPDSAFTLTHMVAADKAPLGNSLGPGSRLRLSRGTLEGMFASGARFVLEAPCDLTVTAKGRISLAQGVAWFEIPAEAVGFTVETKELTVVDLGTKFGIVALPGGRHEVHVTQGKVEATSMLPGEAKEKIILKAGQARRLEAAGHFEEIAMQPGRFPTALPELIAVANPSFDESENTSITGDFEAGQVGAEGGLEIPGWNMGKHPTGIAAVGWKDIPPNQLHPFPPDAGRNAQALALITGASVMNTTGIPWGGLRVGDRLTLTISLGMRTDPSLNWNEGTFFALTDATADPGSTDLSDTVANSGIIANNPATGTQSGNGTFTDVSFAHTVRASDLTRPGNIGILIHSRGKGGSGSSRNQSFFDNVRLKIGKAAGAEAPEP